jgi:aldose 1-epimerase
LTTRPEPFGTVDGTPVLRVQLANGRGTAASVITLGATLQRLTATTTDGPVDLVLGYDTAAEYVAKGGHLGATAGRFANRIGGGRFVLDGRTVELPLNEGGHTHLHGGPGGFGRRIWEIADRPDPATVALALTSPDGDQGYPGRLVGRCTYRLGEDDVLAVEMTATSDAPTPVNLVHHSYWNLAGSGGIDEHRLTVAADHVLAVDERNVPTGSFQPVAGTPLDLRTGPLLGRTRIDHCYVLGPTTALRRAARLEHLGSGRVLEVWANQPGVQVYTAFRLDTTGHGGRRLAPHAGVCLETEAFPDAPNHAAFPSAILRPGEVYRHLMEHRLTIG